MLEVMTTHNPTTREIGPSTSQIYYGDLRQGCRKQGRGVYFGKKNFVLWVSSPSSERATAKATFGGCITPYRSFSMAEEDEVEKYKRLYEDQRAKVKDLERQNSQLKEVIQQLMAAARQSSSGLKNSTGFPIAATGQGGRARSRPGTARTNNSSAPLTVGGRGRGTGNANQRASAAGGAQVSSGTRSGEGAVEEPWDPSAATGEDAAVAAAAAAAAARRAQEAAHPPEPDVRGDIVSQMREASMSKDKMKLEAAIKKAEEAGLHFEANQGRRQLSRITG